MRKGVFYFDFYNPETEQSTLYGFNMDYLSNELEEDLDKSYEEACCDFECDYGVHDWSSSPDDEVSGIGYTSYEVEEDKYLELMEKWQNYLGSRNDITNVTDIVKIDVSEDARLRDLEIYNLITEELAGNA